jgi:hypothetical protein
MNIEKLFRPTESEYWPDRIADKINELVEAFNAQQEWLEKLDKENADHDSVFLN